MELQQVEAVDLQVLQTALDELAEVVRVVARRVVRAQPAPGLGGDVERLAALFAQLCQQALATAVTVNVCSVEKIDAQVERAV
jgi:hypothetical protein